MDGGMMLYMMFCSRMTGVYWVERMISEQYSLAISNRPV